MLSNGGNINAGQRLWPRQGRMSRSQGFHTLLIFVATFGGVGTASLGVFLVSRLAPKDTSLFGLNSFLSFPIVLATVAFVFVVLSFW
jgi:hypothetical protein